MLETLRELRHMLLPLQDGDREKAGKDRLSIEQANEMPAAQPRQEIGVNSVRRGRSLVRRKLAVRLPDRPECVEPDVKAVGEQGGQVRGQPGAHVVSNRRGPKRAIQMAGDAIPYGTAQRTKEISKRDIAVVAALRCRVARTNERNPRGQSDSPSQAAQRGRPA
ncbi:hypothetical protein [Paraburkholderia sp. JPY419]|uniref:hypothetical protein n=1 Tax=Paraburkholderia sp. JPY419 TaxID=667660 RepID=UPI003D1C6C0F